MALSILHSGTAALVAAATSQQEQLTALLSLFAGGNATAKVMAGNTLLSTTVIPLVANNVLNPMQVTPGIRVSRVYASQGTPTRLVLAAGATDVFELTAGIATGDVPFASVVTQLRREKFVFVITTTAALPMGATAPPPAIGIVLSATGSATVGVPFSVTALASNITSALVGTPANVTGSATLTPGALNFAPGELSKLFSATYTAAGSASVRVTAPGGVVSNTLPITVVDAAPPPPSGPDAPITLGFDAQTPEQISFYCLPTRTIADGTWCRVEYKPVGSGSWSEGHPLLRIVPGYSVGSGPVALVDAWAGAIFNLVPGVTYDVRLTMYEPGQPTAYATGTRATRALPAASGAATVTATTASNLQTVFNALTPGAVLELADGAYTLASVLQLQVSGTVNNPIFIRGATRDGVVVKRVSGFILQVLAANHIVLENLTLEGSSSDSGTAASSIGVSFWSGAPGQTNITFRRILFKGVDQGIVAFAGINGVLVYDCELDGNNTWDKSYTINPAGSQFNLTWNDDGISLPGLGNCAFNNTISGFGDTFSVKQDVLSAAVYFYRNRIPYSCDDACEGDYATRNFGFYDNWIGNAATLFSSDPIYGGPSFVFRNICLNVWRGPLKMNTRGGGQFYYNNTIVRSKTPGENAGWYVSGNGGAVVLRQWAYVNNALIYRNAGATPTIWLENGGNTPIDFTHNAWFPDATSAFSFRWNTGGSFANLAAAAAGIATTDPLFGVATKRHTADVVSVSDPFADDIDIGIDYQVQYTGSATAALSPGSSLSNAGRAVPGITDGFSGAAPDIGAVIAGRPVPVYGVRANTAPMDVVADVWTPTKDGAGNILDGSWANLTPGRWHRAAGTQPVLLQTALAAIGFNAGTDDKGNGDLIATFNSWVGGVLVGNRMIVPRGGGHNDSSNNGSWGINFERLGGASTYSIVNPPSHPDNPAFPWSAEYKAASIPAVFTRYGPGSDPIDGRAYDILPDGKPTSAHTYRGVVYDPLRNSVITTRVSKWTLSLDTSAWTRQRWQFGGQIVSSTIMAVVHYSAANDEFFGIFNKGDSVVSASQLAEDSNGADYYRFYRCPAGGVELFQVATPADWNGLGGVSSVQVGPELFLFLWLGTGAGGERWGLYNSATRTWTQGVVGNSAYTFAGDMEVAAWAPSWGAAGQVIRRGSDGASRGQWWIFDMATKSDVPYVPQGLPPPEVSWPGNKYVYYPPRNCIVAVAPSALGTDAVYVLPL